MKIGLVGYQGGGKSTLFELLTGTKADPARAHQGQVGIAMVPDDRFDRLVAHYKPKKVVPSRIELMDTPGLSREHPEQNAARLGVIREATALVLVVGSHAGADAERDIAAFADDLILADLQVVNNRIERLKKDVLKPRPDREELREELACLEPIVARLDAGQPVLGMELSEAQQKATKSFSLLTLKRGLVVLNTADSSFDAGLVAKLEAAGHRIIAAPVGLELEVAQLPDEDREMFAQEMGLGEPCRMRLLRMIFDVTDQITFYTSGEKEVHAWLLKRGGSALDAADAIHSDLARGFVRAEVWQVDDLLRLGSERDLKAAGLNQVVGKEHIIRDGDEIFIRSGV